MSDRRTFHILWWREFVKRHQRQPTPTEWLQYRTSCGDYDRHHLPMEYAMYAANLHGTSSGNTTAAQAIIDKLNNVYSIVSNSEMDTEDKEYCMHAIAIAQTILGDR